MSNSLSVTQFEQDNLKHMAKQFGVTDIKTSRFETPFTKSSNHYLTTAMGFNAKGESVFGQDILVLSKNEAEEIVSDKLLESVKRAVDNLHRKIGIQMERSTKNNLNIQKVSQDFEKMFKRGCVRM